MSNIYIQEPPTSGKIIMKTSAGDIDLELWAKEAPKASRNFIQLCMEGYYDNTIFHRVVKGFIVQGGDPTGTGEGGESIFGEPFKDEFHTRLRFCRRGLLAMANAGKDDNGSQFFFTMAATPELQNKHTIFGKVTGETVFNMIKLEDALVDEDDRPIYPQKILKTEILNNPFDDILPRTVPTKKIDEQKAKKKSKQGVKDFKLLSFGEEAEEDEEESVVLNKKFSGKSKSAHDNLSDPKLSSQSVIESYDPPTKKLKEDNSSNSESGEENDIVEKKKLELTERIKQKLNDSKKSFQTIKDVNDADKEVESDDEEYYLGKDKKEERKRQTEKIKQEIREFKRDMRNEKNKKMENEKQKAEEKKVKEVKSELIKQFLETQEKYTEQASKNPKKDSSRENFTLEFLNKFKSKINNAKEQNLSSESVISDNKEVEEEDDDNPNNTSWMARSLFCEDKAPVLAKDASTKDDDWFEIYDPRNPINKRRRGENVNKSKGERSDKYKDDIHKNKKM